MVKAHKRIQKADESDVRQRPDQLKDRLEAEKNGSEMLTEDSKLQDIAHESTLTHVSPKCNYYQKVNN